MACYCFEWGTGTVRCIGRAPPDPRNPDYPGGTIEDCRRECRRLKMAVLCNDSIRDQCWGDECAGGATWFQRAHIHVRIWYGRTQPDEYDTEYWIGECANDRPSGTRSGALTIFRAPIPNIPDYVLGYTIEYQSFGDWYSARRLPTFRRQFEVQLSPTVFVIVYDSELFDILLPDCAPSGSSLKTPCCLPTETGGRTEDTCAWLTPRECYARCGRPFEGTIWNTDPCPGPSDNPICELFPCYRNQPTQSGLDPRNWTGPDGHSGYCTLRTAEDCTRPAIDSTLDTRGARSCFETRVGQYVLDCVWGDWELVYRPPAHEPPRGKFFTRGSAEIVSAKPERVDYPFVGAEQGLCTYHYGDVAYERARSGATPSEWEGAALGTICVELGVARDVEAGLCPYQYKKDNWCPMYYGADGNARFNCGYQVAHSL